MKIFNIVEPAFLPDQPTDIAAVAAEGIYEGDFWYNLVEIISAKGAYQFEILKLLELCDIAYCRSELIATLEQIPRVLQALRNDSVAEFFFEYCDDSLNAKIIFSYRDDLSINSRFMQRPTVDSLVWVEVQSGQLFSSRDLFIRELEDFVAQFLKIVRIECPVALAQEQLIEWTRRTRLHLD